MTSVAERESKRIIRPMFDYEVIPSYSTADLLMPNMCHFVHVDRDTPNRFKQSSAKGYAQRLINLDKKYRVLEPQIKALRESGITWRAVRKELGMNFHALEYCKNGLGMSKYGKGD